MLPSVKLVEKWAQIWAHTFSPVKCISKEYADHLIKALKKYRKISDGDYKVEANWDEDLFCG